MTLSEVLKDNNLKVTSSRRVIFKALDKNEKALNPKELYEKLKENNEKVDLVSIYRNLEIFSKIGISHRFQDGRYKSCLDSKVNKSEPNDFIRVLINCIQCGKTKEIIENNKKKQSLESKLASYLKSLSKVHSLVLQGKCCSCNKKIG